MIERALSKSTITEKDHGLAIIDDLCATVRNGASVGEFFEYLNQIDTLERAHGHGQQIEPNKLKLCLNHEHVEIDLNALGSDGFNLLQSACSSASLEIIEYLITKR